MAGVMWNRQRQGFEGRWWCNPSPLLKANSYPSHTPALRVLLVECWILANRHQLMIVNF